LLLRYLKRDKIQSKIASRMPSDLIKEFIFRSLENWPGNAYWSLMLGRFCVKISRFLVQVLLGTWMIHQPVVVGSFFFVIDFLAP
jgi:hypothetical protein